MSSEGGVTAETAPRSIAVRALLEPGSLPFAFEILAGESALDRSIAHNRIQKPGLALVGFFEGVSPKRIQVLGLTECAFLGQMDAAQRARACSAFFTPGFACVVVTTALSPPSELMAAANAAGCVLLRSPIKSSSTINALHALLDELMAPRTHIHGVLVDVFGVGTALLGPSGIGKSECALELVQRGHRLVADDVIECRLRAPDAVYGSAHPHLRNHLEVRGLGVLNIKDLFGVAAVRERKRVHLVVRLHDSNDDQSWDRLGLEDERHSLLGVALPFKRLPVRPGRNNASAVEVAARNELLRAAGHHSAREFHTRLARAAGVIDPSEIPTKAGAS